MAGKRRMAWRIGVALATVALLAVSCRVEDEIVTPTLSPTPAATPGFIVITPTSAPSLPPLNPSPVRGGTLTIAARGMATSLDVHQEFSPNLAALGPGIVYSRLFRFRAGPSVVLPSLEVACDLCSSWRLTSPTTLEVSLREEARWQDLSPVNGRSVSPEDVVLSLERQRTPGWPNATILESVAEVVARDRTVLVRLKRPDADIFLALADGHSKVLPAELVHQGGVSSGPLVGSGPWIQQAQSPPGEFTFTANPDYFEKGLPYLDTLRIRVLEDEDVRLAAFRLGRLDVEQVPGHAWRSLQMQHPEIGHLRYPLTGTGIELAIKTTVAPFTDPDARQALFLGLDPWSLNQQVWGNLAWVSSGVPVLKPGWLLPEALWRQHLNDSPRAEALLQEMGVAAPVVEVTVADFGDSYVEYGQRVVEQLQRVGFDASIQLLNPREYATRVWGAGKYIVSLGPPPPVSTPNVYLKELLHSQGKANTTGYRDGEVDRLIEGQRGEWDPVRRREQVLEIQRRLLEGAVRFMPATQVHIWAWWPRVQNLHLNLVNNEYDFLSRVWVKK